MIILLCSMAPILAIVLLFYLYEYTHRKFVLSARGAKSYVYGTKDCSTKLDLCLQDLAKDNDGLGYKKNAIGLIKENIDAFAARILAAKMAGRSLDLMYYIFEDDRVGKLLLHELVNAADRGVRVRLLIDDINVGARDSIFRAIDKHPNIEIRLFNPCRARGLSFKRALEMALRAFSLTRRMHNKAYIADGRIAFVGGRNIADGYFGTSQNSNARDLDVLLTGPIVSEVETIFDAYWNSEVVIPITGLVLTIGPKDLAYWKGYLYNYRHLDLNQTLIDDITKMSFYHFLRPHKYLFPVENVQVLADPPEKAVKKHTKTWLAHFLFSCLDKASKEVQITSPYFVPGVLGVEQLKGLVNRGIKVSILTNSLATTDVAAAYGGYIHYRKELLEYGIKLYELRPPSLEYSNKFLVGNLKKRSKPPKLHFLVRHSSNLHTKAFLIDKYKAFVGSFNFDMRSVVLNTEMGIYFECKALATHMDILFYEEISPLMSYRLITSAKGELNWVYKEGNLIKFKSYEPAVSLYRRLLVRLVCLLPIKSQL